MGYTIKIGNAVPYHRKDDGILDAGWTVKSTTDPNAPVFINDEMTGDSNSRSPSYSGWADFCKTVGLQDMFYGDYGLLEPHPGCHMLNSSHLEKIQTALIKYQATTDSKPGFIGWNGEDTGEYDGHLARLFWLEFWVRWALANCETPAIENY